MAVFKVHSRNTQKHNHPGDGGTEDGGQLPTQIKLPASLSVPKP